jgi:hypothetical protein
LRIAGICDVSLTESKWPLSGRQANGTILCFAKWQGPGVHRLLSLTEITPYKPGQAGSLAIQNRPTQASRN